MPLDVISKSTLQRLPSYLRYLQSLGCDEKANISATSIAAALGLNEVQVRKDIASVASTGRPRIGYNVLGLISQLEMFLGYDSSHNAVIVGAGKLGCALMGYRGFSSYGINIVAAFDTNSERLCSEKNILDIKDLPDLCKQKDIKIGIITVPAANAQEACDLLVSSGIAAIWNFAPTHITVPEGVLVQNENMAASLAILSKHLEKQI